MKAAFVDKFYAGMLMEELISISLNFLNLEILLGLGIGVSGKILEYQRKYKIIVVFHDTWSKHVSHLP